MRFLVVGLAASVAISAHAANISASVAKVCDVRDYGAKGDGLTLDTSSIQNAIEACAANPGGGIVRLSGSGTFLSGPIELRSHVRLDVEGRSTLLAQHAVANASRSNTTPTMVSATHVEDVAITGSGTIDGNARFLQGEVAEAPHAIDFFDVKRSRIDGVTIHNSESVSVFLSRDIHVANVRIESPVADHLGGIGVKNTQGMSFEHVSTSVGSFALALGTASLSSSDASANDDVRISDCTFRHGAGLVIQSVRGLRAERLLFAGTSRGIDIHAVSSGIRDLSFSDIEMFDVERPIDLETASLASMAQVAIRNVQAVRAKSAGSIAGASGSPITGLTLQNVNIEADTGLTVENAQGSFDAVKVKSAQGQGVMLSASAIVERK